MEEWRDVKGYEGYYQVNHFGAIRRLHKHTANRRLKAVLDKYGYLYVCLSMDGISKKHKVHRIVAEAFLENKENLPQINHKDENKQNNHYTNLEWCDCEYNNRYGTKGERISKAKTGKPATWMIGKTGRLCPNSKVVYQYDKDMNFIREWECANQVERELGFASSNINANARGKMKTAYGFIWKYVKV